MKRMLMLVVLTGYLLFAPTCFIGSATHVAHAATTHTDTAPCTHDHHATCATAPLDTISGHMAMYQTITAGTQSLSDKAVLALSESGKQLHIWVTLLVILLTVLNVAVNLKRPRRSKNPRQQQELSWLLHHIASPNLLLRFS